MRAKHIRQLRQEIQMTQKEVAAKLGVTIRTVQNWESRGCSKSSWLALQGLRTEAQKRAIQKLARMF